MCLGMCRWMHVPVLQKSKECWTGQSAVVGKIPDSTSPRVLRPCIKTLL